MSQTDEALYVNLKVLAKLQPYQRINTRHVLFHVSALESSDTYTKVFTHVPEFIKRWWEGSTRDSDFARIRDLITKSLELLQNDKSRQKIIEHLREAIQGLENLKKTYENDLTFKCRIVTLIENIRENIGDKNVDIVLDFDA